MDFSDFTFRLVQWYKKSKRDLPWRINATPYTVWLSEIILQQTRVVQGLPYYEKFVKQYKDICSLAKADENEVLRTWQGLGYYSRARNLHKCAKKVCFDYKGKFPATYNELLKLPGVGPYTAAAIASISFNEQVAVMDGNVIRVISRIFSIEEDTSERKVLKEINAAANSIIPQQNPGEFNQAIMELGALVCMPKNPDCENCPVNDHCQARLKNIQHKLPLRSKKIKKKHRYFYYWVIVKNENIALWKRKEQDIWSGLYDFYLTESIDKKPNTQEAADNFIQELIDQGATINKVDHTNVHVLTHQIIHPVFIQLSLNQINGKFLGNKLENLRFYKPEEVWELPKPILIDRYLREAIN